MAPKWSWRGVSINLGLLLAVLLLCGVGLELAWRALPISDSMGWNRTLPLAERAKRFEVSAPMKIVALGDSFAEWRAGEESNMFDLLQKDFSDRGGRILNLGHAGTDVSDHTAAYHNYVGFKPDAIIMCLYLGHAVLDYDEWSRSKRTDLASFESQQSAGKQFIKRQSTVINSLFRLGKQHLAFMQSGSFDKMVKILQKQAGFSDAQVQSRMAKLDPKMIEYARSDTVNGWTVAFGLILPAYYQGLFLESSQKGRAAADSTLKLIQDFYRAQGVRNFLVVLVPESLQVSQQYDDFFKRCGYDLDNFPIEERRGLTRYLQRRLGEQGIMTLDPIPALEKAYPAYIPLDIHLDARGHKVLAEAMAEFMRNNFLWKAAPK
jgi:hypothetical protein